MWLYQVKMAALLMLAAALLTHAPLQGAPPDHLRGGQVSVLVSAAVPKAADAAQDDLLKTLVVLEQKQYEAMSLRDEKWKDRPAAFENVKAGFAKEFRALTGWNELLTVDQFCEILAKIRLNKYALSDYQLISPNADTAILAYLVKTSQADQQGGHEATDRVSSTWVRREGKWLNVFHQSTTTSGAPFSSR